MKLSKKFIIQPHLKSRFRVKSVFKDIKEAISGSEMDFTEGSIGRAIFILSIPMALEMVMESLFALVDIFFVGKLGEDAIAIVGTTESMMTIIYAIGIGLSMATSALVSRRIGEKNSEEAARTAVQAIFAGMFLSLILALPGLFYARDLLQLMGCEPDAVRTGYLYTTLILSGNLVIMWLFIINAIFRSAGDAAVSMRVLWIANLINMFLDPCLILGLGPFPEWGITGAAIATTIGRGAAVFYQFYLLFSNWYRIRLRKELIGIQFRRMLHLLRISLGGFGQYLIATSSWIVLMRIINTFGSEVAAGYNIAIRIIIFMLLPSWGLSNAATTLVGQNLGANKPERAERSVWKTALANIFFLGLASLLFLVWPEAFVGIFNQNGKVETVAVETLQILSIGFIGYGVGMVLSNAFNGAGDTRTPTIINFIAFWLMESPMAYYLAINAGWGAKGVIWSIVISESALTLIAFFIFRKGKWKLTEV